MGIEAAIIGAAIAGAVGTGASIIAGEQGRKQQKAALGEQQRAQEQQAARASMQQRRSEQRMAGAARREPDVARIMGAASAEAAGGPSSTMLTGPMGVNPQDLNLGRSTLLGG